MPNLNMLFLMPQSYVFLYCMIHAGIHDSQVLSRMHLFAACFRGINDMASNRLKSRNVHSEIVFSFAPNNNVSIIDFRILLQFTNP